MGGVKEAKGCGGPQRPATAGRLTTPGSERVKRGLEPCEEPATARETAGTQWQEHLPVPPWGLPDPARTRGQGAQEWLTWGPTPESTEDKGQAWGGGEGDGLGHWLGE